MNFKTNGGQLLRANYYNPFDAEFFIYLWIKEGVCTPGTEPYDECDSAFSSSVKCTQCEMHSVWNACPHIGEAINLTSISSKHIEQTFFEVSGELSGLNAFKAMRGLRNKGNMREVESFELALFLWYLMLKMKNGLPDNQEHDHSCSKDWANCDQNYQAWWLAGRALFHRRHGRSATAAAAAGVWISGAASFLGLFTELTNEELIGFQGEGWVNWEEQSTEEYWWHCFKLQQVPPLSD